MTDLADEQRSYLESKYGLGRESIARSRMTWAPDYKGGPRLSIPIRDRYGMVKGHTYRKISDKVDGPKSIICLIDGLPLSWYGCYNDSSGSYASNPYTKKPLLLVEDQFSALRASSHINAVALLGTNLSEPKINDIRKVEPSKVILALDRDAVSKTTEYYKKYAALFPQFQILLLDKDLKDLNSKELLAKLDWVL